MTARIFAALALLISTFFAAPARADEYQATIDVFKKAVESKGFFGSAYGYAVFPTIGKGGAVIGGAYGKGRVYRRGTYVGNTSMTQLSVGFQLGGQAYSQIVFFQDEAAFKRFTTGKFAFGAEASAVAITAGASAKANTTGATATASGTEEHAKAVGDYVNGMAVFTVAKGGLMYEASINGQKFNYKPR